jgi:hypothetical protein
MENVEFKREEQWLAKIASEYDGSLPYQNETEVILWLQKKAAETKNRQERKQYKALIEEAKDFGSGDDWGKLDPSLVRFARLLQLLQSRVQNR